MKKMKIIKFVFIMMTINLAVFLFGCQEVTDELAGVDPEGIDTLVIKMIPKSSSNPVFLSAKHGALEAADRLSEKYRMLEVRIDWQAPKTESAYLQTELIRSSINDGTDAIIVSCVDVDSLKQAIDFAVDNGIPVMTFDSDSPDSKRFSFYGPDDVETGKLIMNNLAELIDGKGKIAVLGGNIGGPNLLQRVKGIQEASAEYPEIQIAGVYYHQETEDAAIAMIDSIINKYPDLKGFAMVGSWAFFGDKLLDKIEPGKIKIVAVDALPVELKYIENNYVQVLLGQPTYRWGKTSVEVVVEKVHLKKKVNEIIPLKTIPVTIENLGGWTRQLKAWGYKDVPEKYLPL